MSDAILRTLSSSSEAFVRSSAGDWSVVGFESDPTPGWAEAADTWASELRTEADWLWHQSEVMGRALEMVAVPHWSGMAAEVFAGTLRTVIDTAKTAATQHRDAAEAAWNWVLAMAQAQEDADGALRAAEDAQEDLAWAHAQLLVIAHADMTGIHRRVEEAEERIAEAKAKARHAEREYEAAADVFARRLEQTLTGGMTRASHPELNDDFTSLLTGLTQFDSSTLNGGTIRPASISVPAAGATAEQIAQWLLTGAYSAGELIAACGLASVMAALALVVLGGVGSGSTGGSQFYTPEEQLKRSRLRWYYYTHNLDGSLKQRVGPPSGPFDKFLNEEPSFERVEDILGKTREGDSEPHREVDTREELEDLRDEISRGGKAVDAPATYDGTMVELPDGTKIGYRDQSKSGGSTIDIFSPGGKYIKVHLPKGSGK